MTPSGPVAAEDQPLPDLGRSVRRGLAWSLTNSLTLRLGTFLTGILLARLLAPEDFGVYAVALSVQLVLVNVAELGLTSVLVRHGDLRGRGPTVTTLALLSGSAVYALVWVCAPVVSSFTGAPGATPVVRLLSVVVLLGGLAAVPQARLQRDFAQGRRFAVDATDFLVSALLTLCLVLAGLDVLALAVGRVTAQVAATVLLFVLARERPRLGWDRGVAAAALSFGAPLAVANLLSWALLTVDNAIVGHRAGVTALGFYVLAFNVSSWPMSVIGMATRSVALPGFVRAQDVDGHDPGRSLVGAVRATALVALPVGVLLAVLSTPVVVVLYGQRWAPAAAALTGLALFGALRVVLDVLVSFLVAHDGTREILAVQVLWLAGLTPALYVAVEAVGYAGAGWVHLGVVALVALPAYLVALVRHGVTVRAVLRALLPGLLAGVPVGAAAWGAAGLATSPVASLALGGVVGSAALALVVAPLLLMARPAGRHAAQRARTVGRPTTAGAATERAVEDVR